MSQATIDENGEIGFLDVISLVAKNWVLLFATTLAFGAAASAWIYAQAPLVRLSAEISAPQTAVEETLRVLEIQQNMLTDTEAHTAQRLFGVPAFVIDAVAENSNTTMVSMTGPGEAEVTTRLNAVIAALETQLRPGNSRDEIAREIENESRATAELTEARKLLASSSNSDSYPAALDVIDLALKDKRERLPLLKEALAIEENAVFEIARSGPVLAARPAWNIVFSALITGGLIAFAFVFITNQSRLLLSAYSSNGIIG